MKETDSLLRDEREVKERQKMSTKRLQWLVGAAILVVTAYTVFFRAATNTGGGGVQSGAMMGAVSNGMVGGDRDSHGCIGSAGYTWCAGKSKCVRPWEVDMDSC
ncbi:hypothetical protein TrCOL_g8842 [Triparma columacea]|uniref:Uncharacterized protein n=1 Tax=Triparma columacea TaxID=722753 RepID=A0A9W7GQN2_9STRA|nr:hypothetical protein TrCOL_g8842 [Triparma columacea]